MPATTPPAGAALISAATGGTLSLGRATLTFAPGALAADAWVVISPRTSTVRGILTTSDVYDLRAFDARTGAVISTFLVAPVLTIAVGAQASASRIWYVAPDGSVQGIATTYDAATGTVSAALPHFSDYVAGSPLAGLLGLIVGQLQSYLSNQTYMQDLGGFSLGDALTLSGITLTIDSISAASPYSGSATFTATLQLALAVGGLSISADAAVSATYTLTDATSLDGGSLLITVGPVSPATTFGITVRSGSTDVAVLSVASATLTQSGADLVVSATGVSASFGGLVQI